MRIYIILLACLSLLISTSCNKGAAPTETKQIPVTELNFAREISGGELTGTWVPRAEQSLEANLADPSQIEGMVDSLGLAAAVTGSVKFYADKSFDWNTIIQVTPKVKIGDMVIPISPFADTLNESGVYQQPWDEAIVLPLHPKTFKIDTVGYTASQDSLMMITLSGAFPYPGFDFVKYYLVFHLVK